MWWWAAFGHEIQSQYLHIPSPIGMFIFGNCLPMTFENRVGSFYGQCPSDDTHGGDDQNDQLDDNDEEAEKSVPIVGGGGLGPRTLRTDDPKSGPTVCKPVCQASALLLEVGIRGG